jgi:hypothetical protein
MIITRSRSNTGPTEKPVKIAEMAILPLDKSINKMKIMIKIVGKIIRRMKG